MKIRKSQRKSSHSEVYLQNSLIKQISLPRLNQSNQKSIANMYKKQNKQQDNLSNIKKRLETLINLKKNANRKNNSVNTIVNNQKRLSKVEYNLDQKYIPNKQKSKQKYINSERNRKKTIKTEQIQIMQIKAKQNTLKNLFSKIQTTINYSQSHQGSNKLRKNHKKIVSYLSLFEKSNCAIISPLVSPRQKMFENKENAERFANSKNMSICQEINKLGKMYNRNEESMRSFIEGQLGLIELQQYQKLFRNKSNN